MTISEILNSQLSDSTKLELISLLQSGGVTKNQKELTDLPQDKEQPDKNLEKRNQVGQTITTNDIIKVGDKTYNIAVVETDEEKKVGLSEVDYLNEGDGMLFIYREAQPLTFTMEDTSIDLDIVFINNDQVIQVNSVKAFESQPITCQMAQCVLEVNYGSNIRVGDPVSYEEKEKPTDGDMLVLDEDGDVQYRLEGGERIFSRISTRKIINQAYKAYGSDNDSDYIKLAKIVFKELNAQDSRDPQYVKNPE